MLNHNEISVGPQICAASARRALEKIWTRRRAPISELSEFRELPYSEAAFELKAAVLAGRASANKDSEETIFYSVTKHKQRWIA